MREPAVIFYCHYRPPNIHKNWPLSSNLIKWGCHPSSPLNPYVNFTLNHPNFHLAAIFISRNHLRSLCTLSDPNYQKSDLGGYPSCSYPHVRAFIWVKSSVLCVFGLLHFWCPLRPFLFEHNLKCLWKKHLAPGQIWCGMQKERLIKVSWQCRHPKFEYF